MTSVSLKLCFHFFALLALAFSCLSVAQAQTSDGAIAVSATDGIEWDQQRKVYIARGDAVVKQDDVVVTAQEIRAFYRDDQAGQTSGTGANATAGGTIFRLEALGGANIQMNADQLVATNVVYDVDKDIMVATGGEPIYKAENGVLLQAAERLVYDPGNLRAQAVGKVRAWDGDNRLNADLLTLEFLPPAKQGDRPQDIKQIIAEGNVIIVQNQAAAQSDRAIYNPVSEEAQLMGNVRLVQNGSVLTGQYGAFFFKQGIARLLSAPPGQAGNRGGQRVNGIIIPGQGVQLQ